MLFPTTLVGSYPQPEWLIDRKKLAGRFPPRVRAKELWRIAPEYLEEAWNDATLLAIRAQERAGLDIITDGEMRRESYSNRFATALEGVDLDNPGTALDRSGHPNPVPRVAGNEGAAADFADRKAAPQQFGIDPARGRDGDFALIGKMALRWQAVAGLERACGDLGGNRVGKPQIFELRHYCTESNVLLEPRQIPDHLYHINPAIALRKAEAIQGQ